MNRRGVASKQGQMAPPGIMAGSNQRERLAVEGSHKARVAGQHVRAFVMRKPRMAIAVALCIVFLFRLFSGARNQEDKQESAPPIVSISRPASKPTVKENALPANPEARSPPFSTLPPRSVPVELTDGQAQGRSLSLFAYAWATRKPSGLDPLRPGPEFGEIGKLVAVGLYEENLDALDLPNGKISGRKFLCYKDENGDLHPDRRDFAEWFASSTMPKRLLDPKMTRIGGHIYIVGCWCWLVIVIGDDNDARDTISKSQ